jgi:hypothetical protein
MKDFFIVFQFILGQQNQPTNSFDLARKAWQGNPQAYYENM